MPSLAENFILVLASVASTGIRVPTVDASSKLRRKQQQQLLQQQNREAAVPASRHLELQKRLYPWKKPEKLIQNAIFFRWWKKEDQAEDNEDDDDEAEEE